MGQDIDITDKNRTVFTFSAVKPAAPDELFRPKLQFTADYGLINDPNGLIYYEGKYHLFYQHNPVGTIMAHMHWGHAVSENLLVWQYLPDAIAPDDMGDMWSGSAIEDTYNLLGLNTDTRRALVLFYTAAGNIREVNAHKEFTQCMAYSLDGGYTFTKYENNPVVPFLKNGNRDPKVIFEDKSGLYIMALYLDQGEYAFLKSSTLTDWELIQTVTPGETTECPDLFLLTDNGIPKWVFAGGDSGYLVGELDSQRGLVNISSTGRFAFGRIYAGQSFNNLPDRVLRIDVQKTRELPTQYFNSFLTVPYEATLQDGLLRIKPAAEIEAGATVYYTTENLPLDTGSFSLPSHSVQVKVTLAKVKDTAIITLFGVDIQVDFINQRILFDDVTMPCHIENDAARLTIIADRICLEIFSADRYVGGKGFLMAKQESILHFSGEGNIKELTISVF